MSILQVTKIVTVDNTTPLILATGNAGGGQIIIQSSNTDVMFNGNINFSNYVTGDGSGLYLPTSDVANAAFNTANACFAVANTVDAQIKPAFDTANAGYGVANTALQNTANIAFAGSLFFPNGRVGIGTTTPSANLQVVGNANVSGAVISATGFWANRAGGQGYVLLQQDGAGGGQIRSNTGAGLRFTDNSSAIDWIHINGNGDVGIGTSTPASKLDVWESALTNTYVTTSSAAAGPDSVTSISYRGAVANTPVVMSFYDVPSASIWYHGSSGSNATTSGSFSGSYVIGNRTNTTAFQERLRIDSSGRVGIGTTTPSASLDMGNANNGWIAVQTAPNITAARGLTWYTTSPTDYGIYRTFGAWSASNYQQLMMRWVTGVIIDGGSAYGLSGTSIQPSGGNVAIGAASSSLYKLYVNAGANGTQLASVTGSAGGTALPLDLYGGDSAAALVRLRFGTFANYFANNSYIETQTATATTSDMRFGVSGVERMRIDATGNVGIGTSTSNARLHIVGTANNSGWGPFNYGKQLLIAASGGSSNPGMGIFDFNGTNPIGIHNASGILRIGRMPDVNDGVTSYFPAIAANVLSNFVGIANANPTSALHVRGPWTANKGILQIDSDATTNYSGLTFQYNGAARTYLYDDNSNSYTFLGATTSRGLVFATNTSGTDNERMRIDASGNVSIGQTSTTYKLQVNGSFAANTKSFVIDHPTKPGMKLRYGSLEGPENGVYVRGKIDGTNVIVLPDYWEGLVDLDSITVNLTSIGRSQNPYVSGIDGLRIYIDTENHTQPHCYYHVYAERKDVEKLVVEF